MRKLFGTDGIRGIANTYPMTPELAVRLGQAVAAYFRHERRRTRILVGKDTRLSGYMFEAALGAGINAMGADVMYVGPLPTPGIAFLTHSMRADAGIVISASHNPYVDNGIKIFAADGFKLPDKVELELEALILSGQDGTPDTLQSALSPENIGRARRYEDAMGRYIVFLKNAFPRDLTLDGLKIVVDCAHGAAYKVAPAVLEELGAEVILLGNAPNGRNINEQCGSQYPRYAAAKVLETGAHLGITLDGDADRVILIDERGQLIDGDQIMAICAPYLKRRGHLPHDTVVATVMSNLGLEIALRRQGIRLIRTQVGDRYVVGAMRDGGFALGGEQSGHMIFLDHASTGDGMVAALQVLGIMAQEQRPLSELARVMEPVPQRLINIDVRAKPPLESLPDVQAAIRDAEAALAQNGRVLVRYSGTQQQVRVMVEGVDAAQTEAAAERIADALRAALAV